MSHSRNILSNNKLSTGLGDRLYSLYKMVSSNPKRFLIDSSNTKPIIGPCGSIVMIDPIVEKFGLN